METKVVIEKNAYHDSVTLMSLSGNVSKQEGVTDAVVSMGTAMNKELLKDVGLLTEEAESATENDLIIAVKTENEEKLNEIINYVNEQLSSKKSSKDNDKDITTLHAAIDALPQANIAIISVPGEYAAREARKVLNKGLHVMIFSDNVSAEDERELKELGVSKKLLVMGPDCGTAIINHVGLGFANEIRQGEIGLVAASGTGLQEVTVQIDHMGYGITQAIGTGGRDLAEKIGGLTMLEGIKLLEEDPNTKVITLISKPPAEEVQNKILEKVKSLSKPIVVCFLDGDKESVEKSGAIFASTLIEAARKSVTALDENADVDTTLSDLDYQWIKQEKIKMNPSQIYIKGLFCGGTLTSEALSILRKEIQGVKSNVAKKDEEKLVDLSLSKTHVLLDMGDDKFTEGKPHPMIEPSLRNERILEEAQNPNTAVLLLDFEIGYGSHEDPVGESYDVLLEAKKFAEDNNRHLSIVAYVCGTSNDKQDRTKQEDKLRELGAFVAKSNEMASKVAGMLVQKEVN